MKQNENNFKTTFWPLRDVLPFVRYAGAAEFHPGGKYQNSHIALEICYVASGAGSFKQGKNARFDLGKGDVFLIKPKRRFVFQADSKEGLSSYFLGIDFGKLRKKGSSLSAEEAQLLTFERIYLQHNQQSFKDGMNVGLLSKKLVEEISEKRTDYLVLAKGYCLEILSLLARSIQREKIEQDNKPSGKNYKAVEKTLKFIEENHQRKLSLGDFAKNVFLSPYHFSRIFKTYTSHSPIKYLNMHRIEKAKELLADESLTFADIAARVGFNDPFYFSAIFKRMEGFSPLQYKKLLR
ncbi:MAG: AraC family transcriptional regulator [Verrucomicrobia bacterium]|nr:AraC family transcriptional regulator [Verrucomicrobiota bacterium]MBU1736439.1 AraC family transcriptional regulator [Verrucomicrobiota bacterium]MBU1857189.1 AraC family transcriptional regulator [Verrucomicrobiota bacterium]